MFTRMRRLLQDRSGVTAIEYGLIAALIGVAIIGGATLLGGSLDTMFGNVSGQIDAASAGSSSTPATPPATP
jgi:pilus assembly protein Flp/PilA